MPDKIESYFVREREYLRRMAAEFASDPENRYAAERLYFDGQGSSTDPHVRWLLEGVAHLTARVHQRLDDDFPQFTEALLEQLYPSFLRPVPAMTIAQFEGDPSLIPAEKGFLVPAGTPLLTHYSRESRAQRAYFRSCCDLTLWPLSVEQVELRLVRNFEPKLPVDAGSALSVTLKNKGTTPLKDLGIEYLDFHISGDPQWTPALYELLCRSQGGYACDPLQRSPQWSILDQKPQPLGFSEAESLLPDPPRSFNEYRLLQEYFLLPEKYLFVRCGGLRETFKSAGQNQIKIVFLLGGLERHELQETIKSGLSPSTLRLGCTPVVNLFRKSLTVRYDRTRTEYLLDDGTWPRTPVFAVHSVEAQQSGSGSTRNLQPVYSPRIRSQVRVPDMTWYLARSSQQASERNQVYLCLRDPAASPGSRPEILTLDCTCSNGRIDSKLFTDGTGDFEVDIAGIRQIVALRNPPAPALPPPSAEKELWELISLLSLNYLSLVEEGTESLQRLLLLNAFRDSAQNRRQVEAISAVRQRPSFAPVRSGNGIAYTRGLIVEIDMEEREFASGSPYLFTSVLERFLGGYVSLNSFSQLIVNLNQGERRLEWPPRAGQRILL